MSAADMSRRGALFPCSPALGRTSRLPPNLHEDLVAVPPDKKESRLADVDSAELLRRVNCALHWVTIYAEHDIPFHEPRAGCIAVRLDAIHDCSLYARRQLELARDRWSDVSELKPEVAGI
jgi:hypothetical protein